MIAAIEALPSLKFSPQKTSSSIILHLLNGKAELNLIERIVSIKLISMANTHKVSCNRSRQPAKPSTLQMNPACYGLVQ